LIKAGSLKPFAKVRHPLLKNGTRMKITKSSPPQLKRIESALPICRH